MTQTERDKLREILPSILTPLFYFVNGDYDNEQQRILGTLAYNANSIMQAHYPEICMAWLRTDDSFYKDEAARFPVEQAEETTVEAPVPSVEPGLYNVDSMSTTLSTNTASAVIYYTTDGTDPQTSDTAVLYNSESINMVYRQYGYTIKAYAKTYKQTSETVTLCYNLAGTSKYKVYMGGSPSWVSVGSYYPTQQVVLSAPSKTGHVFKEWQLSSDDGTSSSEVTAECLGNNKTNNIVSFNMPRRNVYVTLCYTPVITSIDLSVTAPRIGEVVGCGAEWSLKKGSQIYCSDGWSGDTSQAVSTNNNRVPADWNNLITKGKNVVTIYLDPTNMFGNRVLSEDQLPVKFSQDVQVTVNGETATASFDGNTLVVTKEFVPKLTQDVSTTVSVGGETGTTAAELVAKLPTKVIGTTDMGDVWIEISGWRIDNFDSSNAGEYTATGTLTADESKFSFNGHPTTITATVALTQGAVLAPTADVASGDYTQAKSVTLTGEAGAAIYYTLDGSEPSSTSSEYSEAISLTGTVGESKIYDLKAIAIKNGVSSAVSEYTYEIAIPEPKVTLTVESFDINPAYSQTFETYEYQYKAGDTISVTAPDETANNESFAGWSVNGSGGSIITDTNAKNRTINFTMPDTTITLVANYIPVVSKVAITLDEPEAGKPLKTTVNSCKATVTVENDVDSSYLNVVWLPTGNVAKWNTEYSAFVILSEQAFTDMAFAFSNDLEVKVNNEVISQENIVTDFNTGLVACLVSFEPTPKAKMTRITPLKDITGINNGTQFENIPLPTEVSVDIEGGGNAVTAVTWEAPALNEYDASNKGQQTFRVKGTIALPSYITAENDAAKTVYIGVSVNPFFTKPENTTSSAPNTGDRSQVWLWVCSATLSLMGIAASAVVLEKLKKRANS